MADETPPNSPPPAADAQMDTLAKELQSMGSIGDATQAADAATPNLAELEALLKEANFELPKSDADPGAQLIADAQGAAQRANSLRSSLASAPIRRKPIGNDPVVVIAMVTRRRA